MASKDTYTLKLIQIEESGSIGRQLKATINGVSVGFQGTSTRHHIIAADVALPTKTDLNIDISVIEQDKIDDEPYSGGTVITVDPKTPVAKGSATVEISEIGGRGKNKGKTATLTFHFEAEVTSAVDELHISFTNPSTSSKIILCGETILGNAFATGPEAATTDITVTGPDGTVCGEGLEQCPFSYTPSEPECEEDLKFTATAQDCADVTGVVIPGIVQEFFTNPILVNEKFDFVHQNAGQKPHIVHSQALFALQYKSGKDPCVVNVTIKLKFESGASPEKVFKIRPGYRRATGDELATSPAAFQQGITAAWSDKFQLCCQKVHGFITVQTPHGKERQKKDMLDTCCPIKIIIENDVKGERIGVFSSPGRDSTQTNWNLTDPGFTSGQTAAHEIGHFLGNAEEYGVTTELKGPITPYGAPVPDPSSVMGDNVGKAYERHFWRILKAATSRHDVFEGVSLKAM